MIKSLKNLKILVVDDDQMLRETIVEQLEIEGAIVSEASNGLFAFTKIITDKYDFVLSDIRMPECSGLELLEKVRAYEGKTPPILMMSSFSDISTDSVKELGAQGLFLKTETIGKFKESIIEHLNEIADLI